MIIQCGGGPPEVRFAGKPKRSTKEEGCWVEGKRGKLNVCSVRERGLSADDVS